MYYYCIKCTKYRKFKNPKIAYIFDKTLVLSFTCDKYSSKEETILKKQSIKILKVLDFYLKMGDENISQEFRLKDIEQTRNYFVEEIDQN